MTVSIISSTPRCPDVETIEHLDFTHSPPREVLKNIKRWATVVQPQVLVCTFPVPIVRPRRPTSVLPAVLV